VGCVRDRKYYCNTAIPVRLACRATPKFRTEASVNFSVITCDAARANENGSDDGVDCDAGLAAAWFSSGFYRNRNLLLFSSVLYFWRTHAASMCCVLVHPELPGCDEML
jgi:hypothetical protein